VAEQPALATRGVKILVGGAAPAIAGLAGLVNADKQTGATTTALVWAGIPSHAGRMRRPGRPPHGNASG